MFVQTKVARHYLGLARLTSVIIDPAHVEGCRVPHFKRLHNIAVGKGQDAFSMVILGELGYSTIDFFRSSSSRIIRAFNRDNSIKTYVQQPCVLRKNMSIDLKSFLRWY